MVYAVSATLRMPPIRSVTMVEYCSAAPPVQLPWKLPSWLSSVLACECRALPVASQPLAALDALDGSPA